MKYLYLMSALAAAISFSLFSFADSPMKNLPAGTTVEAPGKVFYKMPTGEIVDREVTLVVPMRGEGQVKLRYASGEVATETFSTRKENQRSIFTVRFSNIPYAPAGTEMELKGTYTRGTNKALYYGDIFTIRNGTSNLNYTGGFFFKADIK